MKLSELKPGNRFRLSSLPVTTFTLINPRVGIYAFDVPTKFVYISDNNQLYSSNFDYDVIKISTFDDNEPHLLKRKTDT